MGGRFWGRWHGRHLLWVIVLGSLQACDCGGCFSFNIFGPCGLPPNGCPIGGQCALEGGTCPAHFQLDPTMTCDDAGTFCCNPLPGCAQLGGVCESLLPGAPSPCPSTTLQGDCGYESVCCAASPSGDDISSVGAEDAFDGPLVGSCNGAPCASGCTCQPSSSDAGGGICACEGTDAGADGESDAESGADGEARETGADTETSDGAAADADASLDASASSDATNNGDVLQADVATGAETAPGEGPCGVIACGNVCACISQIMSACVCP